MRRISIKGGYGEHGRSCFMVEYGTEGRCYIVDCGIMDTDPVPWPAVTPEELAQADFLFLTHCHKDHAGAFGYFAEQGFRGWLVTSQVTLRLSGIAYNKILILDETEDNREGEGKSLADIGYKTVRVNYGRSGHCPGGLWYLIKDELGGFTIQGGRVSIVPVANKPTMAHVDFPKPFQGQPYVIVTPVTSVPGTNVLGVGASNNTKNGFDAYVTRTNTTETILAWIAIGT